MSLTSYRIEREGVDRLLFLMHGYSAEQHHLAAYVPLIDPDERFSAIAPRGPIDLPDGDGAAWWSYDQADSASSRHSMSSSLAALEAFIAEEAQRAGVPLERCVVGGFSQGGYLALALAGKSDGPRYGGVWAICCGMPTASGVSVDLSDGGGRPALYQWGTRDTLIGPDQPREVIAALEAGGWDLRTRSYDMGHTQTIEMMIDARDWLGGVLA